MIDQVDLHILDFLQANARLSNAEIARRVGLTPPAIFERIKKLEKSGVIKGYHAKLDYRALGFNLLAFTFVSLKDMKRLPETGRRLADTPGVCEVHYTAGKDCFLLKLRCRDTEQLQEVLEAVNRLPEVAGTNTIIGLKEMEAAGPGLGEWPPAAAPRRGR